jgi:hypothetical protein
MEAAVDAPSKPGERDDDPYGGLHYALRSMHVQHFTTVLALSKAQTYKLQNTTGFVGVRRIETKGVQVTLEQIGGHVEPDVAGVNVRISSVDGWAHGKEKQVAHLDVDLDVASGKLVATLDYFDRPKTPLKITLHKTKGLEATLMTWVMRAGELFTDAVEVDG